MNRTLENTRRINTKNTLCALSIHPPTWYIWVSKKTTIYLGALKGELLTPTSRTEPTCMEKQFSFSKALKGKRLQNWGQISSHDIAKSSGIRYSTGCEREAKTNFSRWVIHLTFNISTESFHSLFKSSPLTHVLELGDLSNKDGNDNVVDNIEKDTKMQDQGATSAKKASSTKPPAGKPDPTAAITSSLAVASLQLQPKFIQYNLSV